MWNISVYPHRWTHERKEHMNPLQQRLQDLQKQFDALQASSDQAVVRIQHQLNDIRTMLGEIEMAIQSPQEKEEQDNMS